MTDVFHGKLSTRDFLFAATARISAWTLTAPKSKESDLKCQVVINLLDFFLLDFYTFTISKLIY